MKLAIPLWIAGPDAMTGDVGAGEGGQRWKRTGGSGSSDGDHFPLQ